MAVLDTKVLAEGPSLAFETFFEGVGASLGPRIVCEANQHPDGAHAKLLRIRRDRLGGQCAAEQRDEFAPPHGVYPKARDHGVSIAGQARASQQKAATYVRVGSNSVIAEKSAERPLLHLKAEVDRRSCYNETVL